MLKKVESRTRADDPRSQLRGLAVGYARVSTTGQGENGGSLEAQRLAIEAYADAANYTLIETFEDVGSGVGERSFYNRKRLQAALDLVVGQGRMALPPGRA